MNAKTFARLLAATTEAAKHAQGKKGKKKLKTTRRKAKKKAKR